MAAIKKSTKDYLKEWIPQYVKDHPTCFYQGFLVALAGGFEQLYEEVGFKCPSSLDSPYIEPDTYGWYSVLNVLGPALALWILCLFGSNFAMRWCQGYNSRLVSDGCYTGCYNFCSVLLRTLVVPLAWVFVALMDGDFLACYYYLPNCTSDTSSEFIDGINCTTNIEKWNHAKKIESQNYGWKGLMGCLLICLCIIISRCCSKRTYYSNVYSNKLRKLERSQFEKLLEEKAKETAEKNVGVFVENLDKRMPKDWEMVAKEYPKETFFVPLDTTDANKKDSTKETISVPVDTTDANKKDPTKEFYKFFSPVSEWVANHQKNESEQVEKSGETIVPLQNPVSNQPQSPV